MWKAFRGSRVNSASKAVLRAIKMSVQTLKQLIPLLLPAFNHVADPG